MLARLKTREQAADLAEAVRHSVETLALPHEQRRDGMSIVTVSVGAGFTRNQIGSKLERLIHEADRALYGAKPTAVTARASSIRTTRKAATKARTSPRS